jgi:hypothetical protein
MFFFTHPPPPPTQACELELQFEEISYQTRFTTATFELHCPIKLQQLYWVK